jgi:predicted nucleotidyltransferase
MASSEAKRRALDTFVHAARQALAPHVVDIRLFGSEARGDAAPDSDLDVLIVVEPDALRTALEDRAIDIAFDVNVEFGVYISPRVLTPDILNHPVWRETPFLRNVARESVPL